jgi:hypothetical protein
LQYLISKKADIQAEGGNNKEVPLQWAVRNHKCLKMLELLLGAEDEREREHSQTSGACDIILKMLSAFRFFI